MIPSSSGGSGRPRCAATSDGEGGGAVMCWLRIPMNDSDRNGTLPAREIHDQGWRLTAELPER
jgi:hypothetical protein